MFAMGVKTQPYNILASGYDTNMHTNCIVKSQLYVARQLGGP